MGQEDVWDRGSVGAGGDDLTIGSDDRLQADIIECINDVLECC